MRSTNSKKIKYGKTNLLSDSDFRNPKIRISIMLDEEIIKTFKERAQVSGEGYQTLMQRALREAASKPSLEARVAKLESIMKTG
jgi:uncharacterized protein (DUF4415 family)